MPDFSVTAAPANLTIQRGGKGTDMITIAPLSGSFGSAVQLTCTVVGPSPMPTCAFSSSSLTPGANVATSTLTITVPTNTAMLFRSRPLQFGEFVYAAWLPLLFGITLVGGLKKQPVHRWVLGSCLPVLLFSLAACGGSSTSVNQHTTNYTVTITGTSGSIQHATQILITAE